MKSRSDRLTSFARAIRAPRECQFLGWNAVSAIGGRVGMALAGCGAQITAAPSLLDDPRAWEARLQLRPMISPSSNPVVDFFLRQYPSWSPRERDQQTLSFRRKVDLFQLDPVARSIYGAPPDRGLPGRRSSTSVCVS